MMDTGILYQRVSKLQLQVHRGAQQRRTAMHVTYTTPSTMGIVMEPLPSGFSQRLLSSLSQVAEELALDTILLGMSLPITRVASRSMTFKPEGTRGPRL